MATRQQKLAQMAYCEVFAKKGGKIEESYARVCRIFPALVHNSGLCQAVAFAQSKANNKGSEYKLYLKSLAKLLEMKHEDELAEKSRTADVLAYQHLTMKAMSAASWLKRYAEALLKDPDSGNTDEEPVQAREEAK